MYIWLPKFDLVIFLGFNKYVCALRHLWKTKSLHIAVKSIKSHFYGKINSIKHVIHGKISSTKHTS